MEDYSVLLADEDNASAVVCVFLLSERGCKIDLVRDGKTLMEKYQTRHYDLILINTDFTDGSIAITRRIRTQEKKLFPLSASIQVWKKEINPRIKHIIERV